MGRSALVECDEQVDVHLVRVEVPRALAGHVLLPDARCRVGRPREVQRHLQPVEVVVHRDERVGGNRDTDAVPEPPAEGLSEGYWVVSGRFAAGEYPGAKSPDEAVARLRTLLQAGIDHFIDLTEPHEGLAPYAAIAAKEARRERRA